MNNLILKLKKKDIIFSQRVCKSWVFLKVTKKLQDFCIIWKSNHNAKSPPYNCKYLFESFKIQRKDIPHIKHYRIPQVAHESKQISLKSFWCVVPLWFKGRIKQRSTLKPKLTLSENSVQNLPSPGFCCRRSSRGKFHKSQPT